MKKILVISASDTMTGAGMQADIKTIQALQEYSFAVVTAVTSQNMKQMINIHHIPPDVITEQIETIFNQYYIDSVKIGMISHIESIQAIAHSLHKFSHKYKYLIIDPILKTSSGYNVAINYDMIQEFKQGLLPLAHIITPNLMELQILMNQNQQYLYDPQRITQNTDPQRITQNTDTQRTTQNTDTQRITQNTDTQRITQNTDTQRITQNTDTQRTTQNTDTQRITQNTEDTQGMDLQKIKKSMQNLSMDLNKQAVLLTGGDKSINLDSEQSNTTSIIDMMIEQKESKKQKKDEKLEKVYDVLFYQNKEYVFVNHKIKKSYIRGTGCCLSSAIATILAKENDMIKAVKKARKYVYQKIQDSYPVTKDQFLIKH